MTNFRADFIANFTYSVTLAAPVISWLAIRQAKAKNFKRHRALQAGLLTLCWVAVLALEVKIRLSGGSGSLVASASEQFRPLARGLLGVHISGAVLTYLLWTWLVVVSWKRFGTRLPGNFSQWHRRLGLTVFGGLCFTALSATGMYFFTFVL